MGRLLLLLIVALGLAPGTWYRSPIEEPNTDEAQRLVLVPLRVPVREVGAIEVAGAWQLRSPNGHFGGYSALLAMGDESLLALTDSGSRLRFFPPGAAGSPAVHFDYFVALNRGDKRFFDLEGATSDPATGDIWTTYEQFSRIERYDAHLLPRGAVTPPEMQGWGKNRGAESIVRLRDGRFVVLSEGSPRWFADDLPALLFDRDPTQGVAPARFTFRPPDGFAPVDMTELPDGRMLILVRELRWRLPLTFEAKLVVADPAEIAPGRSWSGQEITHLAAPLPMDNYEGLAVQPGDGGRLVLWLISDDNFAKLQRTLLLKLLWRPNEKAPGVSPAPS